MTGERPRLGWKVWGFIIIGILLVAGLGLGIRAALKKRESDRARAYDTVNAVRFLAREIEMASKGGVKLPLCDGTGPDPTGMHALVEAYEKAKLFRNGVIGKFWIDEKEGMFEGQWDDVGFRASIRDGWGRPILYRCPGPVHRRGWDVYSVGPDGEDDHGGGDDILWGEDGR
jgi:hypothetical protein